MTSRALVCAPRLPEFDRESGSRRLYNLIEFLLEANWNVTFVTPQTDGERYAAHLRQLGVATFTGSSVRLEDLLSRGRFRLAVIPFWNHAEPLLPEIRRLSQETRILVDSVDLHFLRNARGHFRLSREQGRIAPLTNTFADETARELNVYAAADGVLAVSSKEARLIGDFVDDPDAADVVADFDEHSFSPIPLERRRGIAFIGNFWHRPNVDAVRYLIAEVVPRLSPSLLERHPISIVGNRLSESLAALGPVPPHVNLVGWVPSIVPYLERARISVLPLRFGAGTKRKLVESLLIGTPTVTTNVAVEGLDLVNGEHTLIADDPKAFAVGIVRLLADDDLWRRLAVAGREKALGGHSRDTSRTQFLGAIDRVLRRPAKLAANPAMQSSATDYPRLVERFRQIVRTALPGPAKALVVSKGDDRLLDLGAARGEHFPQSDGGGYAGYYPATSRDAIDQLESLRKRGSDYILFPSTSFWWLEQYREFGEHLKKYRELPLPALDTCRGFDLTRPNNGVATHGANERPRILVLGIYLAHQENHVDHIVGTFSSSTQYQVVQRWVALHGEPPTDRVASVTCQVLRQSVPKFEILNRLLAAEDLSQYEYVVVSDDDIVLPTSFADSYLALQSRLEFALAQPARTGNSYIDHPIVEQQKGVLARQTRFVEIGPVVSFHRAIFPLVFPFDLTSPMGWGYENVWSYLLTERGLKMGIIDALPVDHSLRKPVSNYRWEQADGQRRELLQKHPHLSLYDCFRVLDTVPLAGMEATV